MKTLKTNFIYAVLAIFICFPTGLIGQGKDSSGSHEGFFLRFLVGGGPGSMEYDSDLTFKSTGGLFHFQVGTEISENLVVFGDLGGFSLIDPEVQWRGVSITVKDSSVTLAGVGVGLSYYIMPANIYLSGSLLMTRTTFEYQNEKATSEWGPGIFLCVGKEWWVGKKWSLGIAGFFDGGWMKDQEDYWGYQADIKNQIFGIAFTATMY